MYILYRDIEALFTSLS